MTAPATPPNGGPPAGMVAVEVIDMAKRVVNLPYTDPNGVQQALTVPFEQMFGILAMFSQALMQGEQRAKVGLQPGVPAATQSPLLRAMPGPALTPAQIAAIAAKQGRR